MSASFQRLPTRKPEEPEKGKQLGSFNNANRIFLDNVGGSILNAPLAGDGLKPPDGWEDADTIFEASAMISWDRGTYVLKWLVRDSNQRRQGFARGVFKRGDRSQFENPPESD
jgi:hypothetical protein